MSENQLWKELSPKEQAVHPETSVDRLLTLCESYPKRVLRNEALPLLAVAKPEVWKLISTKARLLIGCFCTKGRKVS